MSGRRHPLKISPELESMDLRAVPSALSFSMATHVRAAALQHAVQVQQQHALAAKKAAAAAHALAVKKAAAAAHAVKVSTTTKIGGTAVASHATQVSSTKATATHTAAVVVKPAVSAPTTQGQVTVSQTPKASATTTDINDTKNGPLAKAGQGLIALYQDFQQSSGGGTFVSTHAANIETVGSSVRVDVRGPGDVGALSASLQGLGMQVTATDPNTHTVEGLLPITKLPDAAQLSGVATISPVYKPQNSARL